MLTTWGRAELLAQGRPRGMQVAVQESLLDRHQQVVSQHTKQDVGLGVILQMVEDRPPARQQNGRSRGSAESRPAGFSRIFLFQI
jgi:hypothetical protein